MLHHHCELTDSFRRFRTDLDDSESVGPFDFSPEEGVDEIQRQMNRVSIIVSQGQQSIGSGVLDLHQLYHSALHAGLGEFRSGMKVPKAITVHEIRGKI